MSHIDGIDRLATERGQTRAAFLIANVTLTVDGRSFVRPDVAPHDRLPPSVDQTVVSLGRSRSDRD